MRVADGKNSCEVECPHCGAYLNVHDPDDFDDSTSMEREEEHDMVCPVCNETMTVSVIWEPVYWGAEAVV